MLPGLLGLGPGANRDLGPGRPGQPKDAARLQVGLEQSGAAATDSETEPGPRPDEL